MDRPERVEATGAASRRECTPGATPEPGQAVFRGRRVSGMPAAGSPPSRSELQSAQARAGVGGSRRVSVIGTVGRADTRLGQVHPVPVIREIGRAGRTGQPYPTGEPGRRPGAHRLRAVDPSAPSVPPGGRLEPEPPAHFRWDVSYQSIKALGELYAARGDIHAADASASALREIDRAVMEAYSTHAQKPNRTPRSTPAALESLKNMRGKARSTSNGHTPNARRYEAIERSLTSIYRLTHAKRAELERRRDDLLSASFPRAAPAPRREALGQWLQTQGGAAHATEPEHSYYTRLAQEVSRGRDPWTVSRELTKSLPRPGNAEQAERLQAAHVRVVRAIAGGLPERPSASGALQPPGDFRWRTAYKAIKTRHALHVTGRDVYAATASASALREIDHAVMEAYYMFRRHDAIRAPCSVPDAQDKLRGMLGTATRDGNQPRVRSIQRFLNAIDRLTGACSMELALRGHEFLRASLPDAVPVSGREALERWLRTQAGAAHATEPEHSYYTILAQEVSRERDPWTVSRRLMESLPRPGSAEQAERLRAAHVRLVLAIAGRLPQQAAVPLPEIPQASRDSPASTSMREEMVERLSSRRPLSDGQVQAIVSAAARAVADGTLGESTSRPEAWARGLVDRVQASVRRRIGDLTESERDLESSDLKRLVELLGILGTRGYL